MSEEQWFLVTFDRDWADEFTCSGFAIFSESEWKNYQKKMNREVCVSWNFGTNEGWDDEPAKGFLGDMKANLISLEDAKFLYKCFDRSWGHFPTLDCFEFDSEDDYPWAIEKACPSEMPR